MKILKQRYRAIFADLFCISGLGYLLLDKEFIWAGVFFVSGLILNLIYRKHPETKFSRILRS